MHQTIRDDLGQLLLVLQLMDIKLLGPMWDEDSPERQGVAKSLSESTEKNDWIWLLFMMLRKFEYAEWFFIP